MTARRRTSRPIDVAAEGGPALFRLVRFWSRRWINRAVAEQVDQGHHVQHILAVEAVQTTDDATVGTVARQLGVDQSGASRIVRDAVTSGYLTRSESAQDRRRAALHLTPSGRDLLAASRQWQRATFDEITATWDEPDRRQFAGYLQRLADELGV